MVVETTLKPKRKSKPRWIVDWEVVGIGLFCALIITGSAIAFYIGYVPGESREIEGIIVSFESTHREDSSGISQFLHVRIDGGSVIRAGAGSHVTPKAGRRVKLIATRMPLMGIERFRFKEFNDPPADGNPLLQRR